MSLARAASNAAATINGIEVTSASNTLNNVIEGLNIRLLQVTEADVDVSVVEDKEAITDAVKAFAKAYSDLATYLREQTKYDAGSKNAGPLQGDSTATGLLNRLRAILNTPSGASSTYPRMSDLGLQLQADGTLSVNPTRLSGALDNLPELRKALSNYDTVDAGNNGFAKRYAILAEGLLATDGSLTTRAESLRKRIKDNSEKQDRLNDRVDQFEQRLIAQYTAMDAKLAQFNSLSSYLTQQLASLNFKSGD
jgi:flagellar hook-associated protein 2